MKGKQIEALVRQYILPSLPNWEVKTTTLFKRPIGFCFCSVGFGTSSFDANRLYLSASIEPLYLPAAGANLIKRLKKVGEIHPDQEAEDMSKILVAVHEQAYPFIQDYDSPEKIAARRGILKNSEDPYQLQAIALSHVLLGNGSLAKEAFDHATGRLMEDGRKWCLDMAEQLQVLKRRMETDFISLRNDLFRWREARLIEMKLAMYAQQIDFDSRLQA
jgi:hypothetical protein